MTMHQQGFFAMSKAENREDETPFGLSLKEPMFASPTAQQNSWTHGIEPSPTASPHGGDGGVDVYID